MEMTQAPYYLRKPEHRRVQTLHEGDADPSHPLNIVDEVYERVVVATRLVPDLSHHINQEQWEKDIFHSIMEQEEVQWAHDNSFDEPHYSIQYIVEKQAKCFRISMYLKPEHCTFWRLQFG